MYAVGHVPHEESKKATPSCEVSGDPTDSLRLVYDPLGQKTSASVMSEGSLMEMREYMEGVFAKVGIDSPRIVRDVTGTGRAEAETAPLWPGGPIISEETVI